MSTFDPRSGKTIDETNGRDDLPADAVSLGVDRDGAIHLFSRSTNMVTVIDTADRVEQYELRFYSVVAWVTVIAQERGWRTLHEAEMFVEILAESAESQ